MKNIGAIALTDPHQGEAWIGIRVMASSIFLTVSLKGDGDVEVELNLSASKELSQLIDNAIKMAQSASHES
jgi:hypothetical protein